RMISRWRLLGAIMPRFASRHAREGAESGCGRGEGSDPRDASALAIIRRCVLALLLLVVGIVPAAAAEPEICGSTVPDVKTLTVAAIQSLKIDEIIESTPSTKFLPTGASVDFVLQKEYKPANSYRALMRGEKVSEFLSGPQVRPKQLVKNGSVIAGSTVVTLDVPETLRSAWQP